MKPEKKSLSVCLLTVVFFSFYTCLNEDLMHVSSNENNLKSDLVQIEICDFQLVNDKPYVTDQCFPGFIKSQTFPEKKVMLEVELTPFSPCLCPPQFVSSTTSTDLRSQAM